MSRTFGLNRTRDHVGALRQDINALKADDLNPVLARHCADTAWLICEWAFEEVAYTQKFSKLRDLQTAAKNACPALGYMQDICTEAKHTKITRYTPTTDTARIHTGDYCSKDFGRDFDISHLQTVTACGTAVWFIDAAEEVLRYWESFCKDHGL